MVVKGQSNAASRSRTPAVSVVMPVFNALPHLDAAVESILGQTFDDFEFIILDDASTDGSAERLREWAAKDNRIRLLEGRSNLGPAGSSQKVAMAARAPLVARMDADDVSYSDRLEAQIAVFRDHPEAGLVACMCDFIDVNGRRFREPEGWRLSRRSALAPFKHGTMMYRQELFEQVGGYRPECIYWEDQDLVTRMAAEAPILVIPRPLYQYRLSSRSVRIVSQQEKLERSVHLMYRAIDRVHRRQGYEDLLRSRIDEGKVDPRVFISLGSQQLWAGGKPHMFRRMLKRGKLGFDVPTLVAGVWTAWASASPSTLRSFLRLLIRARNAASTATAANNSALVWHPRGEHKDTP